MGLLGVQVDFNSQVVDFPQKQQHNAGCRSMLGVFKSHLPRHLNWVLSEAFYPLALLLSGLPSDPPLKV